MSKASGFLILFLGVFVAALWFWGSLLSQRLEELKNQNSALIANNNILLNRLTRSYNDKIELEKQNRDLEELARTDAAFDWNADISNSDVVIRLRQNANKIR
ncbi:MAG: hypothetical protein IJ529_03045 [Alphaproteobacteria bacterium]|nr:hypothetical protein [Alphaproteobacteria bacterium]MBR1649412.1 hypothetical protein [Alphaproteobacteria bacterium]